ncbi:X-ray repair cross-complementing protein 6 [Boothiomyces sp. JEL0866]|nr:X-ray repair cross-complementing protein 6 [Boothiomyces sp. JEL0866]
MNSFWEELIDSDDEQELFKQQKGSSMVQNIYTYRELDSPDAPAILDLEKYLLDFKKFEKDVGYADSFSLVQALSEAQVVLNRNSKKNVKKFFYLITSNDEPFEDAREKTQINVKTEDIANAKISLEVIGIDKNLNQLFDYSKLFEQCTYFTYPDEIEPEMKSVSVGEDFEELRTVFTIRETKTRTAFTIPFTIGQNITIGVKGYNVYLEKKKPNHTWLNPVDNTDIETKTSLFCATTAKELSADDICYYYEFGGEKPVFTKEEIKNIKSVGPPGLKLLGFRPIEDIKDKFNIKPSIFMVPDESRYQGSTKFFVHLVDRMHVNRKAAFATLIARKGASIKFVALLPQRAAKKSEEIPIDIPCGFNIIILPFADDMRHIEAPIIDYPKESLLGPACDIVKNLTNSSFDFQAIRNPVLEKFYSHLKAVSLNRLEQEEINDETLPNNNEILQKCGSIIEEFNNVSLANVPEEVNPVKRTLTKDTSVAKKVKFEEDLSDEAIRNAIAKGTLAKYTIPVLTEILKKKKVKITKKKKQDLLDQVTEAFK